MRVTAPVARDQTMALHSSGDVEVFHESFSLSRLSKMFLGAWCVPKTVN